MVWSVEEWNAFITGLCFFLVFSGWSAVSNIVTSTHGHVGSYSLSIVYLTLTISNLITAKLISKYPPKIIMTFSSLGYCLCIAANISDFPPIIIYLSSLLVGFGAACIWVSQQLYITQCANYYEINNNHELNSKLGYFNGLFYMIYNFKKIVGPAIGAISLSLGASISSMYSILTFLCLCGGLGFLTLKPLQDKNKNNHNDEKEENVGLLESDDTNNNDENNKEEIDDEVKINLSVTQSIYKIFKLWNNPLLWKLVPYTIFAGMDASFVSGVFPLLINGTQNKFYMISYGGIVLSVFSIIIGKLSDKFGRLSIMIFAGFCQCIVYAYIMSINFDDNNNDKSKVPLWHILILSTLIAMSQSGYLTQLSAIYPIILQSREAEVFANLKLFQSLSQGITFYIQSLITIHSQTMLTFSMLIFGLIPLLLVNQTKNALQTVNNTS